MKVSIDISADKIALYEQWQVLFLERNGVDVELGKMLVQQDRGHHFSECLVLNGPWGFTNLRVGTLALNLLKTLKKDQLSFFTLSKPELYHYFYQKGRIGRYGAIYIGQKLNVWLRDLEENKLISTVKKSELSSLAEKYSGFWVDQVYEEGYFDIYFQSLHYSFNEQWCHLVVWDQTFSISREDLLLHPVEKLEPNYMIEPNVS